MSTARKRLDTAISPSSSTRSSPRLAAATGLVMPPSITSVNILVPQLYEIPSFYQSGDPQMNAEAINIGAYVVKSLATQKASTQVQELEANHQAELNRIQQDAADKLAELEKQQEDQAAKAEQERQALRTKYANLQSIMDTQAQLAEQQQDTIKQDHKRQLAILSETQIAKEQQARQDEKQRIQNQMDTIVRQLKEDMAMRDASNQALKERIHQIQADRDRDIKTAEDNGRRAIQALLDEKQASIERLEKERDRITSLLEAKVQAQNAEINAIQQLGDLIRRKPAVSATKGKEFETQMEQQIHNAFSVCEGYALTNTANNGRGHEADFLMNMQMNAIAQTVLWECKNYDNPVPTKEVQKLYRDAQENPAVSIAVMISKFTPIVGHTNSGDLDIEFINDVMYIYISRYEFKSEELLKSLMFVFRLFWQYRTTINVDESKQKVMKTIMELHTKAVKTKSDWRKHKSGLEATVSWMGRTIDETEESLRKAIQTLEGNSEIDVPEGVFNDPKNEAESSLIQRVLKLVTFDSDESLDLNELAKVLAQDRQCTENTAKNHLKSILLESIIEARSGKPTRVKGMVLNLPDVD
jgi:hypothetical protein